MAVGVRERGWGGATCLSFLGLELNRSPWPKPSVNACFLKFYTNLHSQLRIRVSIFLHFAIPFDGWVASLPASKWAMWPRSASRLFPSHQLGVVQHGRLERPVVKSPEQEPSPQNPLGGQLVRSTQVRLHVKEKRVPILAEPFIIHSGLLQSLLLPWWAKLCNPVVPILGIRAQVHYFSRKRKHPKCPFVDKWINKCNVAIWKNTIQQSKWMIRSICFNMDGWRK